LLSRPSSVRRIGVQASHRGAISDRPGVPQDRLVVHRTGSADLPLHGGRVPSWLAERMSRLGRVISEAIVLEYGRDELLRRLAHPFWFQSFGAVMGMDWHSSGITTAVLGTLKRGLAPIASELGIHVCGGVATSRDVRRSSCAPSASVSGIDGNGLAETSRLVAKVDSAAVQDGFALLPARLHRHRRREVGGGPARDESREPQGAALSLAVRRSARLLRRPARGDRGSQRGRHREPRRRARDALTPCQLDLLAAGPDRVLAALRRPENELELEPTPRQRSLPTSSCRRATTCVRATWSLAGSMAPWRRQPIGRRRISPTFC
jgi:hypothetical protein